MGAVVERLDVPPPAVLSVVADMNTPRIPSMKDILGAGKKPSRVLSFEDVGFDGFDEAIDVVEHACAPSSAIARARSSKAMTTRRSRRSRARVRERL